MRKNCSNYPVEIVDGVFSEDNATLADMLKKASGADKVRVMLVADQNVVNHVEGLGTQIGRWMQAHGVELACPPLLLTGGERLKSDEMQSATEILRAMLRAKIGAGDVVLAIGGGTLLDVTGWAAAQTRGGVAVVRMPTSPAAMVDAAFATYAAVDLAGVKDSVRVPCAPAGVVIDLAFAPKVLEGVWRAGFAVAMRQALTTDATLVKKLLKLTPAYREKDPAAFKELVEATVASRLKKGVTDFALWITHRLETLSGYKLPYGYAVALGIQIDTAYATMKGAMKEEDRKTICDALTQSGAMEGAMHSRHLLGRDDLVLLGLDSWKLVNGTGAIVIPSALGKGELEENPDRDTMKRAVNLLK